MEVMLLLLTYLLNGKMSNRYLKTNSKAKKGISPVIATVILVAVAVVIAAAMAGFAGSLFGTYSNTQQLSVKNAELFSLSSATPGDVNFVVVNKGASADQITSITIADQAEVTGLTIDIAANSETPVTAAADGTTLVAIGTGTLPDSGQQVTMTIHFKSGAELTQSMTAKA